MKKIFYPSVDQWEEILARPVLSLDEIEKSVLPIMHRVKTEGDLALISFAKTFDGVVLENLEVTQEEWSKAEGQIDEELKAAIQVAAQNIQKFHALQQHDEPVVETQTGVFCWRKSIGIEKVGLYIPGGTAPLFSTVLMLAIPAKIAGCKEVVLCSPPNKEGNIHPAILYAAQLTGVDKVFKAGGAQAIAAMTFGTESIPKAYKILGPGNQYVMAAKQLALKYGVSIDMPAGPSEVAVIADHTANPQFIAADLLSQAEHGNDSQVILFTDSEEILNQVETAVEKQLSDLSRANFASKALENSKLILVKDLDEAMEMSNAYAPEHLILQVENPEKLAEQVVNAGSVFLGHLTPESAGDYASGTNHTLPTNGYARAYSGVSLDTFVKKVTFQKITSEGLKNIGPVIEKMATAEELDAHKNAVTLRLNSLS
ncbi:MAG TPA: histidinol dehydrogenase [Chitinophagales bacterium]|nr:histidinol dehydrogenase [Chitinophagales bacterium]